MIRTSKKIRILTYYYLKNNGAVLFAYYLNKFLQKSLVNFDIKLVNYRPLKIRLYDFFKIFKFKKGENLFYFKRYFLFNKFINHFLNIDNFFPQLVTYKKFIKKINNSDYSCLIVAMDVWNLNRKLNCQSFPNPYWLSDDVNIKKIAFSVSSYNSKDKFIYKNRDKLKKIINSFDLIGARDSYTYNLIKGFGVSELKLKRTFDPTLCFSIRPTDVLDKMIKAGIDINKPILGILIYGNNNLSSKIRERFKREGFQIVALSSYNLYADFNLGYKLNPFEWADIFKYLDLCISDRFHGAIFAIKSNTPLVCIEPNKIDLKKSKIYSLLVDLDLLECYKNDLIVKKNYNLFFDECFKISKEWSKNTKKIEEKIDFIKNENINFVERIRDIIS